MIHKTDKTRFADRTVWTLSVVSLLMCTGAYAVDDDKTLQQQLEQLRQRVQQLEAGQVLEQDTLVAREAVSETKVQDNSDQPFEVGGALRFNYVWKDFDEDSRTRRGDIGLDLFRLNIDGKQDNILMSVEYRFYSFMDTIHHGWLGYDFDGAGQLQIGISQVPFGLLPYASHNFWFGLPYYIGLADDYDTGVKYIRDLGAWNVQLAFYKNEELGDAGNLDRYSYDPVTTSTARNEETNTVNARVVYTAGQGSDCSHELGVSLQRGQLFNQDSGDRVDHWATAAHVDSRCGRWNFQLEAGRYAYNARNPAGVSDASITFGAFAFAHEIAAEGEFGVVNVAYNVPADWPGVDLLTCYNDYSVLTREQPGINNSYLNTTGCAIGVGPTFTYIDIIQGRNALFLGDGSLAGGGSDDTATRFNINLGYYW